MIRAIAKYRFEDKDSFESKIIPYLFGGGIFYKKPVPNYEIKNKRALVDVKTGSLSQLITVLTGMLRYSAGCVLEDIEIVDCSIAPLKDKTLSEKISLGVILKPSLKFQEGIVSDLIKLAVKNKIDFVKDDDASEYSKEDSNKINGLVSDLDYFQKIVNPDSLVSDCAMIVPWVDGWNLVGEISNKHVTMVHCAGLSQQISWSSHIIFSRLAGASFVVVSDPLFDKDFNLDVALDSATRETKGVGKTKLILSGGINPERIKGIIKSVNERFIPYIGFAVGSWVLSGNLENNFALLKEMKDDTKPIF
ncbi:MAG: hypothetical protein KJ600_06830 [Nanoarchaeota archaeon]|nr:hypothetical protein [Nanoarchaeota archaeon]MBU1104238.1 hypothetical protein [Nanoarchaeota archaeon]